MATTVQIQSKFTNAILHGDCIDVMRQMPAASVDFILTDPPYLVNYRDRMGRTIRNDIKADWLKPAMKEAYRVLKQDRLAVMFYGWTAVDKFFSAWRETGFQPVGHLVFRKSYASKCRLVRYQHEQALLLAKGRPPLPKKPISDVIDIDYSGNTLHPTQKPISALVLRVLLPSKGKTGESESTNCKVKQTQMKWAAQKWKAQRTLSTFTLPRQRLLNPLLVNRASRRVFQPDDDSARVRDASRQGEARF